MRRIGGGFLSRLVDADLIWKPEYAEGRNAFFVFASEVRSLERTAAPRLDPQVGR